MNSEIIKAHAELAIALWKKNHSNRCLLRVDIQEIKASKPTKNDFRYNRSLIISRFELVFGLTNARWNTVGNELFTQYLKESRCQTLQKH